jgi:hypothetical protein
MEQSFPLRVPFYDLEGGVLMQAAIDHALQTYGLLANLTAEQERIAR